jgi:hypothetical protein
MGCCDQPMVQEAPPRPSPEMLVSMPDETWCCLARMTYGIGRAAVAPDVREWESLSLQEREDVAQTLKAAISQPDQLREMNEFMAVLVRIGKVMTNTA